MKRLCTNCVHCRDRFDCEWGHRELNETYAKKCEDFIMVKKNFGWVLYDAEERGYRGNRYGDIKDASVHETREVARLVQVLGVDRVLKVSLDSNGRPVAVVGRG